MAASQPGPRYTGWWNDPVNSRLAFYYNGTKVGHITGSAFVSDKAMSVTGGLAAATGDVTATAGNVVATAGDLRVTAGNARFGTVNAFATTQPAGAVVFNTTTKPVGAVTNSAALYAATNGTIVHKMLAGGVESNVET